MRLTLKIFKFIFIGLLTFLLLLNLINIFQRVAFKKQVPLTLGFGSAVIISGSMEPTINIGDMIIIREQSDYEERDVIVYQSNSPITHRVETKTLGGYITKGDNNNALDPEIEKSQVIGKVVGIIPNAGHVISFLQKPLGMLLLIFGLFAMIKAPRLFQRLRKDSKVYKNARYFKK